MRGKSLDISTVRVIASIKITFWKLSLLPLSEKLTFLTLCAFKIHLTLTSFQVITTKEINYCHMYLNGIHNY